MRSSLAHLRPAAAVHSTRLQVLARFWLCTALLRHAVQPCTPSPRSSGTQYKTAGFSPVLAMYGVAPACGPPLHTFAPHVRRYSSMRSTLAHLRPACAALLQHAVHPCTPSPWMSPWS